MKTSNEIILVINTVSSLIGWDCAEIKQMILTGNWPSDTTWEPLYLFVLIESNLQELYNCSTSVQGKWSGADKVFARNEAVCQGVKIVIASLKSWHLHSKSPKFGAFPKSAATCVPSIGSVYERVHVYLVMIILRDILSLRNLVWKTIGAPCLQFHESGRGSHDICIT